MTGITLPKPTPDQMEYLAQILRASEYDGSYVVGGPKPVDDGRLPDRETYWLVERRVSPPLYVSHDGYDLTMDAFRAKRFATERAAHDFWRLMNAPWRDECRAVEHMFINKP